MFSFKISRTGSGLFFPLITGEWELSLISLLKSLISLGGVCEKQGAKAAESLSACRSFLILGET